MAGILTVGDLPTPRGATLPAAMSSPAPSPGPRRTLHPVLRVALYLPALAVATLALGAPIAIVLRAFPIVLPLDLIPAGAGLDEYGVILQGVSAVSIVLVTYLFRRWLDRRPFASLGFERPPGWLREGFIGFMLGVLLMALVLAVELALGAYRFRGFAWEERPVETIALGLLVMFAVFSVVSFEEELVSRGYLLQNLAAAWGWPAGVFLSSALFALAHFWNPGANLISTLGIFVAGVQLAAAYLATGRLWMPMGLHLSWNFFQGPAFGFPVSGLDTRGLLLLDPVGPVILTGGEFGPEASIVGLVVDIFGIWLLWRYARGTSIARPTG